MTAERHAGAPPRWHDRFSPTWWAAWTFALARPGRFDDEDVPDALADADDVPAAVERLVVRGLVPADALDPGAPRRWDATTTLTGLSIAGCGCGRARVTLGGLVRVVEADLSDPSPGVAAALAEEVARSQNPPWGLTLAHVAVDATRRTLDALATEVATGAPGPLIADPRRPIPGTKLVREWQGEEQVVTVLTDGFEWQGRRFKSLSAAVRAITGSHWNGWKFFGLAHGADSRP